MQLPQWPKPLRPFGWLMNQPPTRLLYQVHGLLPIVLAMSAAPWMPT
jgi:hypothetical protein